MAKYECEGQLSLFDLFETPQEEPKAAEQFECDGCIFETKSKCCSYNTDKDYCVLGDKKITNALIKQLIDDLEAMYPGKIDVKEYTVWEHVPNLGKRLWLNIEDVGDTWDLTGIIDKYKEASLEVSISAVPHFVGGNAEGNNLYISTMWKTKGHKEVLEYDFKTEAAGQNVCKFSEHTCNKEELWKVAESFDDIECPKICCRQCKVKCCGARCNGSEEPKEEEPKCSKAKECEAYTRIPRGCGGSIEPCRWGGPFKWSEEDILENDTQVPKSKRSYWIGDDYLKYISKAIKEKDKDIKLRIQKMTFSKSKDYIKPFEECIFKKSRNMDFNVDDEIYTLRFTNDGSDGSVLVIKKGDTSVANILTREIVEDIRDEEAEAVEVDVRGLLDDGYCPECNMCLDDLVEKCPSCGTLLSWNEWRKANGEAESG